MSVPLRPDDPAYWMLRKGRQEEREEAQPQGTLPFDKWRSKPTVYRKGCYICEDPEFALMGLPLCYPCLKCKGHVAADDGRCDDCGADQQELYEAARASKGES